MMIKKSKILVVEDEKDVKDLILLHLKRDGHETDYAENGEDALRLIQENHYDLIILDWMLPGVSGLEICKKINHQLPILMITARADTTDIVLGLEMGADDYLTKPFEIPIFLARTRALLRRAHSSSLELESDKLKLGELLVDLSAHRVTSQGEEIQLTPSEFKLLGALIKNQGKVLSRERLIELVQGQGVAVVDRAIDTHVFGLRKKLGTHGNLIETIRGVGYRVESL